VIKEVLFYLLPDHLGGKPVEITSIKPFLCKKNPILVTYFQKNILKKTIYAKKLNIFWTMKDLTRDFHLH